MSEAPAKEAPPEPDTPISRLLGGTIARHAALLKELGYDFHGVSDFHHTPAAELTTLLQTLKERSVPDGHLGKIKLKLEELRSVCESTYEVA